MKRINGKINKAVVRLCAFLTVAAVAASGCSGNKYAQTSQPVFSQNSGIYSADLSVAITSDTPEAVIHYTTDGQPPTASSPIYDGPITVSGNNVTITVKAIAEADGYAVSATASATYSIAYKNLPIPILGLAGGTYTSDQAITLSCAKTGAIIRYTTDGTDPTIESPAYTEAIPVSGDGTALTVKAFATLSGYDPSDIASAEYRIDYNATEMPTFSEDSYTYSHNLNIRLSSATSEAVIYYTDDGAEPSTESKKYANPIPITGDGTSVTIKAIACAPGHKPSSQATATYGIDFPPIPQGRLFFSDVGLRQITVNWNPASDGIMPTDKLLYKVQRYRARPTASWERIDTTVIMDWTADIASCVATGLAPGEEYYFECTVKDGADNIVSYKTESVTTLINPLPTSNLYPDDAAPRDYFGQTLAMSGDYAIVGCPHKDKMKGAAYIFIKTDTGWVQQAKLCAADRNSNDGFASSVAIDGEYAIVGAGSGNAAYAYHRTGTVWSQQAKLVADDAASGDYFGESVALSGDYALIGAVCKASYTGAAYIFARSGSVWVQQAKLTADDGAASDRFGSSVSLSADTAVIGSPNDDPDGSTPVAGSAYVFTRSGTNWAQQSKLIADDGTQSAQFGTTVYAYGDSVIIGAPYQTNAVQYNTGAAYCFSRSGTVWKQSRLICTSPSSYMKYGSIVSISEDYALIAGSTDNSDDGFVAAFKKINGEWSFLKDINPTNEGNYNYDDFGSAIAISGKHTLIGNSYSDLLNTDCGSVYDYYFDE